MIPAKLASLLALAQADGLQQPNVEIFHFAGTGPHKLPHTRQNVFERFKLQSEFCKRRGVLVSFEPKREGVRTSLRTSDPLLLEGQRPLGHRGGFALCLVDLLDCEDVRQVDRAQLVLQGAGDVSECVMDLVRRVVIEQVDRKDLDFLPGSGPASTGRPHASRVRSPRALWCRQHRWGGSRPHSAAPP